MRTQLVAFWLLLLVMCAGLGAVMFVLYQNSGGVQIGQARTMTQRVCESIAARYRQSADHAAAQPQTALMQVALQLALIETPHVEGGIWETSRGFLAYAYPTYEGGGAKLDVPQAERPHIEEVAKSAVRTEALQTDILRGSREALVLTSCPLATPGLSGAVWIMTRVPAEAEAALGSLRVGLGVLLVAVVCSGAWLGSILTRGYRHVSALEVALGSDEALPETVPRLKPTGVAELDRIITAVNRYSTRLVAAQEQARSLLRQQAHDQRLTALGRMTGGVAHEIRNPIATMRLKAENALATEPAHHAQALHQILIQIDRLDRLVENLLATVQPLRLQPDNVILSDWIEERQRQIETRAEARGVHVATETALTEAFFDPLQLARAIDNLLDNAVRHAPQGGHVRLTVLRAAEGSLLFKVVDDGPGVAADLAQHLFEPFATSRAEGTGLGLALVREIAVAHGGTIRYQPASPGSSFELELPWRVS